MRQKLWFLSLLALLLTLLQIWSVSAFAQAKLTSPKEHFGFNIGDDYQLANYTQLEAYWKRLAKESDRVKLTEIGKSEEGRTMYTVIITSPENHKKLARYQEISRRLGTAEGLTVEQARALAAEGKAVVWIDGGLHATEVLGAQQLIETVYQLVSGNDAETKRFLNDVIVLCTLVNPDGMELVSNWYMREPEPAKRSTGGVPRLYQKYVGHDDNRDFYMSSQSETEAINRVFYRDWFPQIVYNHHQTGPAGAVMFAPPFRDPFNYNFDPLVVTSLDLVSAAMHSRFIAENKPGTIMRSGAPYSTWFNGGLRTTTYFHNMIGILTETIGNPTPIDIPFLPQRQLPKGDYPYPITPQKWHFRQSIEYSLTANRAVLDAASRYRETLLFNFYHMGKNSIERGSRDSWTMHPKLIDEVQAAAAGEQGAAGGGGGGRRGGGGGRGGGAAGGGAAAGGAPAEAAAGGDAAGGGGFGPGGGRGGGVSPKFFEMLRRPELRDPRGYIIPSDQADFLTATKFVNTLIKAGITIHRATASFQVNGKNYPAGSYVVKCAQAFRPHVLDMFEPQDHPDDIPYPGGPPTPPYDTTGWTLAYQMGVQFDRILDGFDGPFEKLSGFAKPPAGKIAQANAAGFLLSHQVNDAFIAVNRLLASNEEVYWLKQAFSANGKTYAAGTIFIPAKSTTLPKLQKLAADFGLNFASTTAKPTGELFKLKPLRIGLWDQYGGSMPSGWVRWLLEQYEFPFSVVYPSMLDAGNLASKFDVLIFMGGIPGRAGAVGGGGRGGGGGGGGGFGAPSPESIPAEYRERLGSVTAAKTIPQLVQFLNDGGTLLAVGNAALAMGGHAGLPITSALVEKLADGAERPLAREKFYTPGSLLQVRVDTLQPLAYGMNERTDVVFDSSPSFRVPADAANLKRVAWYDSDKSLRSGWSLGQKYLQDSTAVIDAQVGKGKLLLFGPEITFRAQPHGTFKFLFNGIYYGAAETVKW